MHQNDKIIMPKTCIHTYILCKVKNSFVERERDRAQQASCSNMQWNPLTYGQKMKCEKALEPIINYHWYLETGLNLGFGTTCTNSPFKHSFENKNGHKKLRFVNISFFTPLLVLPQG
jgi:hypothetical protein